jgi:hypothetical protein
MTIITFSGLAGAFLAGWLMLRRRRASERERKGREAMRAHAATWGIALQPDESTSELASRIQAVSQSQRSGDPIQTAARALRAQREARHARGGR